MAFVLHRFCLRFDNHNKKVKNTYAIPTSDFGAGHWRGVIGIHSADP
jgi:hypothetical protein